LGRLRGYRLKIGPPAGLKLKGKAGVALPIMGRTGLSFEKLGNIWYGDLDYSDLVELTAFDASQKLFAVYDRTTGEWGQVSFASLISAGQTYQVITTGDCVVQPNDGLIIINKTVGAATVVTLPAAATKVGKVKIVDFKGDAATNNITVAPNGAETFNGGATSWVISGDGASVVFDPIPTGLGYAV
jgi:hypothetical protein